MYRDMGHLGAPMWVRLSKRRGALCADTPYLGVGGRGEGWNCFYSSGTLCVSVSRAVPYQSMYDNVNKHVRMWAWMAGWTKVFGSWIELLVLPRVKETA